MSDFGSVRRPLSPNWNSGLKTLPRGRFHAAPVAPVFHGAFGEGARERWTIQNEKTLDHQRSRSAPPRKPRTDEWSSGLKTLENAKVPSKKDRIHEISQHRDHGAVDDWEYTSTMHKTLEVDQPKPLVSETWMTENHKVLPDYEAHIIHPYQRQSPFRSPRRLLETETVPTTEWQAAHKVVPANRRRRFLTNNQGSWASRSGTVERAHHLPSDGTWNAENFKVLEPHKRRHGPPQDEWEGGAKIVPEPNELARDRHMNKVLHPYTWQDENGKTLPYEYCKAPDIYRFSTEGTGWDSALYKTLPRDDPDFPRMHDGMGPRLTYALNHDWYMDGKVIPREAQNPNRREYVVAGTGWDSGLKVLPPSQTAPTQPLPPCGREQSHARNPNGGYWDLDNRKTLAWETAAAQRQGKHVALPRHRDMMKLHERMCRRESTYVY